MLMLYIIKKAMHAIMAYPQISMSYSSATIGVNSSSG